MGELRKFYNGEMLRPVFGQALPKAGFSAREEQNLVRPCRLGCQHFHGLGAAKGAVAAGLLGCWLVSAAVQNSPESSLQKREGGSLASNNQFSHLWDLVSWSVHLGREARSCNLQVGSTTVSDSDV